LNPAVIRKLAVYLAAFALGGIFLYAAYPKIVDPPEFARIVYHYRMLGPSSTMSPLAANLLAVVLPWVEAVAGVLLIVGLWRREAAIVTALMLVMFLVAVGWAMSHGIDVENCGCFSVKKGEGGGRGAGWGLLAGDTAMLAAALFVAWGSNRPGWTKPRESNLP
jgi:putative oxidoreductase